MTVKLKYVIILLCCTDNQCNCATDYDYDYDNTNKRLCYGRETARRACQ